MLLKYVEDRGDFINSDNIPSIVDVDEVQNNLGSYLILDVRSVGDYELGHIQGAINITPDNLIDYLISKNAANKFIKVIIASASGQASFSPFVFHQNDIRNYAYVIGPSPN